VNRALRVYQLNLYRPARGRAVRKPTSRYVLVAVDDGAAFETALALHAKVISRAAFAELMNDQDEQAASWNGGVASGVQASGLAKAEARPPSPADIQWGASKVSHWAQTRSLMFRMVRVASISGR
jgi:hypothetical protein